ncbi:T7SS effector LXG polymorphic toxin [Enterococcus phoeniculicola]|uniref:T7SS effector LXG polymorphic toxin n=1 Tax=Enterococcus phoeniculicola TaxID=154621 RepID=UPI00039C52AF|nr:T7SS effector LXG polymorphic toxin [Enterococcus phoeniculicola]
MSIDMYVSSSQNQATSVSKKCREQIQSYQSLQKAISQFTLTTNLKGAAYDSAKAYFANVLYPLAASIRNG